MEVARLTEKQREANRLLAGPARNIMLRGGSRSGKTFVLVRAIIQRAINAPGSRHAIFRFRFNHAKTSVWSDTLPKVLLLCFPTLKVRFDKTDFYVELPNGSQVWIAGLDDKERVEKILGQEYATLYFNESSQIPWASVETAMSRLAQKCKLAPEIAAATGRLYLALKAYFDCNPPSKLHWSFQMFRAKMKPGTKEKLAKPEDYAEMQVNPADNSENLPPEYFEVLASMSAAKRLRFEAGEWASEVSGALWALEDRRAPDGKLMPGIAACVSPALLRCGASSFPLTPPVREAMARVTTSVSSSPASASMDMATFSRMALASCHQKDGAGERSTSTIVIRRTGSSGNGTSAATWCASPFRRLIRPRPSRKSSPAEAKRCEQSRSALCMNRVRFITSETSPTLKTRCATSRHLDTSERVHLTGPTPWSGLSPS